ncbi:MAG: hypothetical protein A2137_02545 [Chloroflexi bacterium RBG_16_58_8]|nr:MAG: hypothetical protein A2137_02545 [Chloroflexi bacterium RBG_16_58_8]
MKSKKTLMVLLTLALLAVYSLLGKNYLEQRREKGPLEGQINAASQTLAAIPAPPADIEPRLAAARAALDAAQNTLPIPPNTTQVINAVLRTARDAGVRAVPLATQPWTTESAGQLEYSVFRLNFTVTGNFTQLGDFLKRLESGWPETLAIERLSVDRASEPETGLPAVGQFSPQAGEASIQVSAGLDIAIYARLPAAEPALKVENR